MKQIETQLLIQEQVVMNEFCYAFSRALLEKIKELIKDNKVKQEKDLVDVITNHLSSQIGIQIGTELKEILTCEKFLAIFEKKQK